MWPFDIHARGRIHSAASNSFVSDSHGQRHLHRIFKAVSRANDHLRSSAGCRCEQRCEMRDRFSRDRLGGHGGALGGLLCIGLWPHRYDEAAGAPSEVVAFPPQLRGASSLKF